MQHPGTAQGTDITWAFPARHCFPREQRDHPRFSGTQQDLSPPPQSLGKSSSDLSCHELPFSMEQLKPSSLVTRQQNTGILIQHPARHLSQASLMLTQPCPIPPPAKGSWHVPGPCPARGAPAQPAPGDLHGFEACQEFYPGIWLPFSSQCACCWFCEASQGQLFGLLTLHYPFHENHLFPAAEPGMSV